MKRARNKLSNDTSEHSRQHGHLKEVAMIRRSCFVMPSTFRLFISNQTHCGTGRNVKADVNTVSLLAVASQPSSGCAGERISLFGKL